MIKLKESYTVGGYDIESDELLSNKKISNPKDAIEEWFKKNQKKPMSAAIYANTESDAKDLLKWASENESIIRQWASKYKCPYKIDWLVQSINNKLISGRKLIDWSGDQVFPFSFG